MFLSLWRRIKWWWTGGVLTSRLEDHESKEYSEAEQAISRIVVATSIAPDCLVATVMRGGPTIIVKHDRGREAFIGRSYSHAADKVIEWLTQREGRFILKMQRRNTKLTRNRMKILKKRAKRQT